ncbi:AAA family ATPase [Pseudooceanicola sp.]|uniref:AAA family ATPase n=1 Tax=Pseudooceanicola sp. TaxID=1914328 RepID=UPI004058A8FF
MVDDFKVRHKHALRAIKRRLQVWSVHTGEALDKSKPLFVIQSPIEMLNALDVSAACDAIAEATGEFGIKIIVPDTLARNFGDGDENSTGDMNRFVSAVGRMIERFGCTVVVVHHSWHGDIMPAKHCSTTPDPLFVCFAH